MNEAKTAIKVEHLPAARAGRKAYERPAVIKQAALTRIVAGGTGVIVHAVGV